MDEEKIIQQLMESSYGNEVWIIPIIPLWECQMDGKTALSQVLFNDDKVNMHFDSLIELKFMYSELNIFTCGTWTTNSNFFHSVWLMKFKYFLHIGVNFQWYIYTYIQPYLDVIS